MISIIDGARARRTPKHCGFDIPLQSQASPFNAQNLDRFFKTKFGIGLDEVLARLNTVQCTESFATLIQHIANYEWQHRIMLTNQHRLRIMLDYEVQNARNTFKQSILGFDHQQRNAIELIASTLAGFRQKAGLETAFHIQHH